MERHIMTWQREDKHDGLHPLFDDILRRQLLLGRPEKSAGDYLRSDPPREGREVLRLPGAKAAT